MDPIRRPARVTLRGPLSPLRESAPVRCSPPTAAAERTVLRDGERGRVGAVLHLAVSSASAPTSTTRAAMPRSTVIATATRTRTAPSSRDDPGAPAQSPHLMLAVGTQRSLAEVDERDVEAVGSRSPRLARTRAARRSVLDGQERYGGDGHRSGAGDRVTADCTVVVESRSASDRAPSRAPASILMLALYAKPELRRCRRAASAGSAGPGRARP